MRTVELVEKRRLEVASRPDTRDAGPGEVVVRMHAVGICGSDLHWYEDGGIGYTAAVYPMILGHEPVGEVVSVGAGVTTHKVGERVAIEPSIVCGECEFCRSGRPNNCVHCVFMGGTQAPGFFRDYAVVPARNAEHFPDTFSYAKATLIEPTAVIVHVFELFDMRPGDTVAVLGAGPIGILSAVMAKLRGASQVFIADKILFFLPGGIAGIFEYLAIEYHFQNVARGVIDTRNLLYFGSVIFFGLLLASHALSRRRGD